MKRFFYEYHDADHRWFLYYGNENWHFEDNGLMRWRSIRKQRPRSVLLAVEVTARWADDGIGSNALNPGAIATGLQKHTGGLRTPKEFQKTNEADMVTERPENLGPAGGVATYALDSDNASRLWREAASLTAAT
ncbi:DUF1348 family protein [Mycolicibacterium sp. CR10]|uniref:DUF1348 family protein n=1 Tax=Mycolicibacterium sp. CR10 TaxID=2562314 RepID=UPI001F0D8AF2|nr:DUF1348 family protein [Mycolicibacterium sp. CR10]